MRRWLNIFLLVLLPFQFTWSLAATYCQHETAAETRHLGHHEHEHKGVAGDSGNDTTKGSESKDVVKLLTDSDCGYCHPFTAQPALTSETQLTLAAASNDPSLTPHTFRTRDPARFERPKWRVA